MDVRESKAQRQAGITNNYDVQISRCFLGRKEKAPGSWKTPIPREMNAASPHLAFGDSVLTLRQNVAGLWLKYGVKSSNTWTFSQRRIPVDDATIC
jgi:hypothetical protein